MGTYSVAGLLSKISTSASERWFSRALVAFQLWFCYFIVDWSMAFSSTALAMCSNPTVKCDLLGAAANVGAVAAIPQALLMLATNAYMQMRAQKPAEIVDRRGAAI